MAFIASGTHWKGLVLPFPATPSPHPIWIQLNKALISVVKAAQEGIFPWSLGSPAYPVFAYTFPQQPVSFLACASAQSGLISGPFSVGGGCFGIAAGERNLFGFSCEGQQVSVTTSWSAVGWAKTTAVKDNQTNKSVSHTVEFQEKKS